MIPFREHGISRRATREDVTKTMICSGAESYIIRNLKRPIVLTSALPVAYFGPPPVTKSSLDQETPGPGFRRSSDRKTVGVSPRHVREATSRRGQLQYTAVSEPPTDTTLELAVRTQRKQPQINDPSSLQHSMEE